MKKGKRDSTRSSVGRAGIQNSNFIFGPIFGPILGHFGAQKAKKRPKNQNCEFSTIFCVENFFAHNSLHFIFLNGIHHISLDFFH